MTLSPRRVSGVIESLLLHVHTYQYLYKNVENLKNFPNKQLTGGSSVLRTGFGTYFKRYDNALRKFGFDSGKAKLRYCVI